MVFDGFRRKEIKTETFKSSSYKDSSIPELAKKYSLCVTGESLERG